MRRWANLLFTLPLAFGLLSPRETAANPIVSIIWETTSGSGVTGGSTIEAAPGDMLTAGLFVELMGGDAVAGYGISVRFDEDLGNELDLISATELLPPSFLFSATPGVEGTTESDAVTVGEVLTFEALSFFQVIAPALFQIGFIDFLVTGNVATDGIDLVPGIFNPGIDATPGGLQTTFNGAAVNSFPTVPEPSAGVFLASGLIALAAGRSRRQK